MKSYILDFENARKYARELGIKNWKDWVKYCASGKKPFNIPSNPNKTYKNFGWNGWNDWLNNNNNLYNKRYSCDENFFQNWSLDMAYILGLWWADGCIYGEYKNYFNLSLHKNDIDLLIKIKRMMKSNHKISINKNMASLVISSKKIYSDITLLGGTPKKSLTVDFPKIPQQYTKDFIRGLWDGDGSIYFLKKENRFASSILSGSSKFASSLFKKLHEEIAGLKGSLCQSTIYLKKYNKTYDNRFTISFGLEDTKKLAKYLNYDDPNRLALERKRVLFLKVGQPKEYKSYKDATLAYKQLGIKTRKEWREKYNSFNNIQIPKNPQHTYKNEWKGWGEWNRNK